MDGLGGKPGWAWTFIIEGLATMFVGSFCWWMVFDWPDTARFLSAEDRLRIQRRLAVDQQANTEEEYDERYIYAALKDWKSWGYSGIFTGCLCPLYAFSLFLPTILHGLGYAGTKAQLLSVLPYACAAAMTILIGWVADRTRWRGWCKVAVASVGIIGFIMLISTKNPHVQYAGTFLGAMGIYPTVPNTLSWISNNFEGVYKRGVVIGIVSAWANINGVVSSNIYLTSEAPRFWTGHGILLGYMVICLFGGSAFMHVMLRIENAKRKNGRRDRMHEGKTAEQIWIAGDNRPDFIYTL